MGRAHSKHGRDKMHKIFLLGNLKGRDHLEDLGIDGKIILEGILGWSGVRDLVGTSNFFPRHCLQTGSGSHPVSYPMGTGGSFPGDKVARP
jgi:hypothetical protein